MWGTRCHQQSQSRDSYPPSDQPTFLFCFRNKPSILTARREHATKNERMDVAETLLTPQPGTEYSSTGQDSAYRSG